MDPTQGTQTVRHPVPHLATAERVYTALIGVSPQTDDSSYVGFEAEGQHIGLMPGGGHPRAAPGPMSKLMSEMETR